jgi:hypothetical protein
MVTETRARAGDEENARHFYYLSILLWIIAFDPLVLNAYLYGLNIDMQLDVDVEDGKWQD